MNIDTVRFSHILEATSLYDVNFFFTHTAFVIAHKSERLDTLLNVIWYLPINSPVLIVTNCPEAEKEALQQGLTLHLAQSRQVYLIHQKDETIARFFDRHGVEAILGADGKVVNGKGEGMYIGALIASLLKSPKWVVFYDADNFVPNALMEYTLAMSKLFMQHYMHDTQRTDERPYLQNVRICWASKPHMESGAIAGNVLGRCTRVVAPLMTTLVEEWFQIYNQNILTPNAGEQGFTLATIQALRFSSGYSVETFQMLDLLSKAHPTNPNRLESEVTLQQYQAQSPHFHEKRDDEHIKRMIADSLGGFAYFQELLPARVEQQLQNIYSKLNLEVRRPVVYPALQELLWDTSDLTLHRYRLYEELPALLEQEAMCG